MGRVLCQLAAARRYRAVCVGRDTARQIYLARAGMGTNEIDARGLYTGARFCVAFGGRSGDSRLAVSGPRRTAGDHHLRTWRTDVAHAGRVLSAHPIPDAGGL